MCLDCVLSRNIFLKACYLYETIRAIVFAWLWGLYEVSLVRDNFGKSQRVSHAYSRGAMSYRGVRSIMRIEDQIVSIYCKTEETGSKRSRMERGQTTLCAVEPEKQGSQ